MVCPLCYRPGQIDEPKDKQPCEHCVKSLNRFGFICFVVENDCRPSDPYPFVKIILIFPRATAPHFSQLPELFMEDRGFHFIKRNDARRLGMLDPKAEAKQLAEGVVGVCFFIKEARA